MNVRLILVRPMSHRVPASALMLATLAITIANAADPGRTQLNHAPTQDEIAAGRQLNLYDDGGDFSSKASDHGVIPRSIDFRKFVWTHWTAKKRGYIRLSMSYIDTTTTWHLFIEPTETGSWHIDVRRFLHWYGQVGASSWESIDVPEVFALERAKPSEHDVHGGEDVLVFRDAGGKEVWRL
jgi:hypothetical protein